MQPIANALLSDHHTLSSQQLQMMVAEADTVMHTATVVALVKRSALLSVSAGTLPAHASAC